MKTYTILATDAREKIDGNYLSLQLYLIPEADIEISRDGWATSAVLKAWVWLGLNLLSPTLRVKGTEAKTISIYNWAFAVKFEWARFWWTANYAEFEDDGTLKFIWDATVYNDIQYSISNAKVPAANFPTRATFNTNFNEYTFAVNDYIDLWSQEIPHWYKEWSDLEIHLHRATNWTNVDARWVKRQIEYCIAKKDYTSPYTEVFWNTVTISNETTLQADIATLSHIYSSIGVISGTWLTIWSQIKMRLKRIAATWTAPTGNPFALQVWIHYQQDTIWSRSTSSK